MEETKKWWQSKIVAMGLALVVGGLSFFGLQYNLIDQANLDAASTVYPEVKRGIDLIVAGQWVSGLVAVGGALIIYFRVKKTSKIISIGSVLSQSKRAA